MTDASTLKEVTLFSTMDDTELAGLLSIMEPHHYSAGQVIISEGEAGDLFHVIVRGTAQYLTHDASGNELVLDEAGPGEFFGELSMLTGEPRSVRVRAREAVETLALKRDAFYQFVLKHPHAGIDVLTVLGKRLYATDKLLRQSVAKNVNELDEERLTLGQKVADGFAATMGSWSFIIVQSIILIVWVILNISGWQHGWDPYPFILLNLALSFQAAYAAPIIMMSQNRQSDKDRLAADVDHQVNIKAELKTGLIMKRLDEIERQMHELHSEQLGLLDKARCKN